MAGGNNQWHNENGAKTEANPLPLNEKFDLSHLKIYPTQLTNPEYTYP